VEGSAERVSVIMAYDLPGAKFRAERNLDAYLYSPHPSPGKDPNYR
jgi:hypothetical protein